ncbi:hypothetical protein HUS70_07430 [Pandoraea nosoerga]|uniref:phage neck terminator protein n=1 Tax=Pandoraea nosoerga TaxID=2508296 RepID=UPI00197D812B|nr:hypothetical protein [Pandoraea nosoerga]MBN4665433.1 hypothetical protein [Pandoraea nosoerga]MBN4674958.1 hypothetical protein [Pandoraea nosoerga]MBN4680274.1 hypothetical protein [Pandoraea nosoerga]MBN4744493.1 hypothetical protein [Pandoraea nosoerga]
MNDSSTGGFLSPVQSTPPIEDSALEDFLQTMIAGITGLDGALVRPFPQPVAPKIPESGINWCGFTVADFEPDANAGLLHVPASDGSDTYLRHEDIEVKCQFYGPNASQYARVLRDGLYVPQNREQLQLNDFGLIDTSGIVAAPDVVNQQVRRRYDVTVRLRRKVTRTYRVLNLLSAQTSTASE